MSCACTGLCDSRTIVHSGGLCGLTNRPLTGSIGRCPLYVSVPVFHACYAELRSASLHNGICKPLSQVDVFHGSWRIGEADPSSACILWLDVHRRVCSGAVVDSRCLCAGTVDNSSTGWVL